MKVSIRNRIIYFFSILSFLVIWEIAARFINSAIILPSLKDVFISSLKFIQTKNFWVSVSFSFFRVIIAFLITFFVGIILGFLCSFFPPLKAYLSFPFALIKSVPVVALIMVMLFWFSSENLPVISAILMTLPIMTESVSVSVDNTDIKLLEMAKVFKLNKIKKIRYIYIPETKAIIKGTSNTVFSLSWKIIAAGEILSMPKHAIGSLIQENRILLEPSKVFSITILLCIISILSAKTFNSLVHISFSIAKKNKLSKPDLFPDTIDYLQCNSKNEVILKIENLSLHIHNHFLINNLNLEIYNNTTTCLFAPSGSGKTTLLNIIAGLFTDNSFSGNIFSDDISYIFQEPRLVSGLNILHNILIPCQHHSAKEIQRAKYLIKQCDLEEKIFSFPDSLSGGEKQKVQICRAFMTCSPLILMDEGTSSLDENTKTETWKFIMNLLKKEKRTLLFVTHDKSEAEKYADKIISIS